MENPLIDFGFVTCKKCKRRALKIAWADNLNVCPNCGEYRPISAPRRLKMLFDNGRYKEINKKIKTGNPLDFPEYDEKMMEVQKKTKLNEAVVCAVGKINRMKAVVAVLDSRFFMGSMSTGVGEKVTLCIEYAMNKKLPLIIFSASGGARMQEGILSLMQMAKTSAAIAKFSEQGGLFISYLTHPTTGGVTASFASLGDIMLAEPGALIGFAGPRVIEQTIGEKLPEGFQKSEFQEEHGFVDAIVPREKMKETISQLLRLHSKGGAK